MLGYWGEWHEGTTYDIRVYHSGIDRYPSDFKSRVEVRERTTGKVFQRRGHGKYIGNFSPIWIDWEGQSMQLTEVLRL